MRDYELSEWLETTGRAAKVDQQTLRLRHVDMTAAIMCLRAAGGPPVADDPADDTAEKAFRLLQALVFLRPYTGRYRDLAAAAAARDYAEKRGFDLRLEERGVPLVHEIEADDLDPADIKRAVRRALSPADGQRNAGPDRPLRGAVAVVSRAVSNPTPGLEGVTDYLQRGADKHLRQHGAQVRLPVPCQHIAQDGRRGGRRRPGAKATRTSELMTQSIERLARSHVLALLGDPQGQGSCVEREWALRLGIPVVELKLHGAVSPHQDGPGRVLTIHVDLDRPQVALAQFEAALMRIAPEVRDCAAASRAFAVKNENDLAHLRAAWQSLRGPARDRVSATTGMSRPYIEGLLSGPVAIELASEFQRHQLELVLYAPKARPATTPFLSYRDLELLGAAVDAAGLTGPAAAHALEHARESLHRTRLRGGVADLAEARRLVWDAITELDLE